MGFLWSQQAVPLELPRTGLVLVAHRLPPDLWNLPAPGIKLVSLPLQGGFLTTGPPGKPSKYNNCLCIISFNLTHSSLRYTPFTLPRRKQTEWSETTCPVSAKEGDSWVTFKAVLPLRRGDTWPQAELSLLSSVTLGKFFTSLGTPFPHLPKWNNNNSSTFILLGLL